MATFEILFYVVSYTDHFGGPGRALTQVGYMCLCSDDVVFDLDMWHIGLSV